MARLRARGRGNQADTLVVPDRLDIAFQQFRNGPSFQWWLHRSLPPHANVP